MTTDPTVPGLWIDGAWATPAGSDRREIRCPADGSAVATVVEGNAADAEAAVTAARRAFDGGG